jgi:hypothetical protein
MSMILTKTSSPTDTTCSASSTCARQLGDVHQALDALRDADERTERDQLGDLARRDLADRVRAGEDLPRVLLRRLQRQRDALAVEVDLEDLDGDLLAHLDDLGGVLDVLPGQLGDVHEAVDAAEVDERTEVDDRGDDALADLALVQVVEERGARLGLRLLEQARRREHDVVAVLVELEDLGLDLLAEVRREVADAAQLDERRGQEAAQADVDDETTLDDLDHGTGDDTVVLLDLLDVAPGALVLRALLGQDEAAFLVLLLENEGFDLVADLDDLVGVDVVLDGELAGMTPSVLYPTSRRTSSRSIFTTVPSMRSPSLKNLRSSRPRPGSPQQIRCR